MTKGNPVLLVRVERELHEQITECIQRRNRRTREEPWDMSKFIRVAIRDKLAKMKRSCRRYGKRKPAVTSSTSAEA